MLADKILIVPDAVKLEMFPKISKETARERLGEESFRNYLNAPYSSGIAKSDSATSARRYGRIYLEQEGQ